MQIEGWIRHTIQPLKPRYYLSLANPSTCCFKIENKLYKFFMPVLGVMISVLGVVMSVSGVLMSVLGVIMSVSGVMTSVVGVMSVSGVTMLVLGFETNLLA